MQKIAHVLGVTIGEFFAAAGAGDAPLIVRAGARLQMSSQWSLARIEALGPMTGRRLEPMLITLEPGGRSAKHPSASEVEEFAYVLQGKPTLTLGPDEHVLATGDAVTVRARELRRWENRSSTAVRILVISARGV
jgi:quercetin dioxygenase-like cupin family protein